MKCTSSPQAGKFPVFSLRRCSALIKPLTLPVGWLTLLPLLFMLVDPAGVYCAEPAVIAGAYHSVALKDDGTVWAWGDDSNGQLGDDSTTSRSMPVQVLGSEGTDIFSDATSVAAGFGHTVALKDDETVWTWGDNGYCQLGDNTTTDRHTPVQVLGPGGTGFLTTVKAVAVGQYHTAALKKDGTVWAWGLNTYGQLGDNTTTLHRTPFQVNGLDGVGFLTGVKAIAAGYSHTVALKDDGTVWAWGWNIYGQLGDDSTENTRTPVQVLGQEGTGFLSGVKAIAAGYGHTVALKDDGTVWAWGLNADGRLGDNTTNNRFTPVQVLGLEGMGFLSGVKAIATGYGHTGS